MLQIVNVTSLNVIWKVRNMDLNLKRSDFRSSIVICEQDIAKGIPRFINIFNSTFRQLKVSHQYTVHLDHSHFRRALIHEGPIIEINNCTMQITHCDFSFNSATFLKALQSNISIYNNIFLYNILTDHLIHIKHNSELNIENSKFLSNSAAVAIVSIDNSSAAISLCIFENNTVTKGSSVLVNNFSSIKLHNSTIMNTDTFGSAIYANKIQSYLLVQNSNFENNSGIEGGAIAIANEIESDILNFESNQEDNFTANNTSRNDISSIERRIQYVKHPRNKSSSTDIQVATITFNSSAIVHVTNSTFINNKGNIGGAFFAHKQNIRFTGCTFTKNSAEASGGALFLNHSISNIVNSQFKENSAWKGGVIVSYGGKLFIVNVTFLASYAPVYGKITKPNVQKGGVFFLQDNPLIITKCKFVGNLGETIWSQNSTLQVINSHFEKNIATGPAVILLKQSVSIEIINSTFVENHDGHFNYVQSSDSGLFSVINSILEGEMSISQRNSYIKFDRCTFVQNTFTKALVEIKGSQNMIFTNCHFIENNVRKDSIISTAGGLTFRNSNFISNQVFGGILVVLSGLGFAQIKKENLVTNDPLMGFLDSVVTLNDVQFILNKVGDNSDMVTFVSTSNTHLEILNCSFEENIYGTYRSALHIYGPVNIYIQESSFIEPHSQKTGSMIYLRTGSTLRIANSMFESSNTLHFNADESYHLFTWKTQFCYENIYLNTNEENFITKAYSLSIFPQLPQKATHISHLETPFAAGSNFFQCYML